MYIYVPNKICIIIIYLFIYNFDYALILKFKSSHIRYRDHVFKKYPHNSSDLMKVITFMLKMVYF